MGNKPYLSLGDAIQAFLDKYNLKEEAEKQPILYNKQFYYFSEWKPDVLTRANLLDQVMDRYMVARPITEFLIEALRG